MPSIHWLTGYWISINNSFVEKIQNSSTEIGIQRIWIHTSTASGSVNHWIINFIKGKQSGKKKYVYALLSSLLTKKQDTQIFFFSFYFTNLRYLHQYNVFCSMNLKQFPYCWNFFIGGSGKNTCKKKCQSQILYMLTRLFLYSNVLMYINSDLVTVTYSLQSIN